MEFERQFVVAIGASAGGLEAIHEFFDHMPETRNMSFVIIQHLSPDYKSLLVDLVSRHTHMRVFEAVSDSLIERNCIYVIPNNKLITIKGYKLLLQDKLPLKFPNTAIDIFLEPLALQLRSQAIAVILSGTGTDGTKGIGIIKQHGGLVLVQDPASARFDGMPNSAISTGSADYILTPKEMPGQILQYVRELDEREKFELTDETLHRIFNTVKEHSGFNFEYYKSPTVTRRIFNRMRKGNFTNPVAYADFLTENPDETSLLEKDLLINVTRFFRDEEAFKALKSAVIPMLIRKSQEGEQIKIWVCACSTGEEAYSIAMLIEECIAEMELGNVSYKIFASDAEKTNIEIAGKGYYQKSIENDVSADRLERYFLATGSGYTIKAELRKRIVFAVHNVIHNPPFVKNDLVTCRNMLIYVNSQLQERIYAVLLFSLNVDGYLFLGPTENPTPIAPHLQEVLVKWKIFRKTSNAKVSPILSNLKERFDLNGRIQEKKELTRKQPDLWDEFKDTLHNEFNFAAFHIDRNFEIQESVGNYDRILSLPKKVLKLNLMRMLPASVSTRLVAEVKKVWKSGEKRVVKNLSFASKERAIYLQALIQPERYSRFKDYTLVAFHFVEIDLSTLPSHATAVADTATNEYVLALEEELNETKESLQLAIENLETANEELQSSNEELLSSNEELQSSNEELQSLNEELHTLNTEHQLKIQELVELNDDLSNYFRSSNLAQIFLDQNLVIRKFNPAAVKVINLIESDIGRPLDHISTNIRYSGLLKDIEEVAKHKGVVEKEVELRSGTNMLLRVMPYVTRDKGPQGVVVSFLDITTITQLNNIIRGVFNSSQSAIFALNAWRNEANQIADFTIETTNHAANLLLNKVGENLTGKRVIELLRIALFDSLFHQLKTVVERDQVLHTDIFQEGDRKWFEVTAVRMKDGLVATFTDITQKKAADERLKKNYVELIAAKETLKKLNAELEIKVVDRTRLLSESEERFRMVSRATNDAIWDWDIANNKLWLSEAFRANFKYAEVTFTRSQWLDLIHEDDREVVDSTLLRVLNSSESQWTGEYRLRSGEGNYHNVLDRGYVMHDAQGTPYRMLGSIMDITDLKTAELEIANNIARRKFLAESMPLIVWTATPEGNVDFVNQHFESYTGINNELAMGRGWRQVIDPQDLARLDEAWRHCLQEKLDLQDEFRIRMHDGNYHWNILRARAQKDAAGDIVNWVITMIDINDQKQQSELLERKVEERTLQLRQTNYALEESNNDLQQFASVASHDLQEPLRKIHMYASMLRDRKGVSHENGQPYLDKILASSARMKSIITNILNYSKLSAKDPDFTAVDLRELIQEILEDLELLIREKHATVHLSECPVLEVVPGQIRQVFQNLIGNALKFSRPAVPPVINITAERVVAKEVDAAVTPEGRWCRITIRDNGIGFDPKFAEQIFILFQRLHSKDLYEGTGIGLAIAKKIIEKHHGLISATGNNDNGATFTVVLPIHQTRTR